MKFNSISYSSFDHKIVLGVVGVFIFFMGFALLLPMIIDFIYQEDTWQAFLITALIAFGFGGGLYLKFKPDHELRVKEAFMIVTFTWLTLSLVGALPYLLTSIVSTYSDAFFEMMSGLTTTGATIFGGTTPLGQMNPNIENLPKSILFWRSLSQWLGGMGIIVLSIAILPLLGIGGFQLFQAEAPGPTTDKLTPRVQETAKLLWVVYAVLTLVEAILLWLHPSMDWFDAINHAFTTMATGGFSTKDASIAGFNSVYIDVIITLFMFLAGVNFALHFRLFTGNIRRIKKNREFRFYLLVCITAISLISINLYQQSDLGIGNSLRYGSFQALTIITTTGFGTYDYELFPPFAFMIIFILFFTGGCAGSTGGGVKMIRWLILMRNSFREIKQIVHPKAVIPVRIGDYCVESSVLRTVLSFFILYLFLFGLIALLLTLMGIDFMTAIGASITSLGNIGPGFAEVGVTKNFAHLPDLAKWLLSITMMIGRLELFTVIVLFSSAYWKQ